MIGRIGFVFITLASVTARAGVLVGTVTDSGTQLGLPGAVVHIAPDRDGAASAQTIATELDGSFTVKLTPGVYTVSVQTPEYVKQAKSITVAEGDDAQVSLAVELAPEVREGLAETVEVYSTLDPSKTSQLLADRRFAATVSDGVSAEQIARSPDSSASDAAKRMVGATVQDGKYVVVRGLGGRYSTTLLNGVPLPSPDPDIPAAPLDLFPASLVANLTVQKSFAPDMPGNFAGGALSIDSRIYPTKFMFRAKVGMADDSASSFRATNAQQRGGLDAFGFDDGMRALPSSIPTTKLAGDLSLTPEQRAAEVAGFKNDWSIYKGAHAGANFNGAATIGDSQDIAGQRVGYFASATVGHSFAQRRAHIARVGGSDGMGGTLPSVLQLDDQQGIELANLGVVGAAGWSPKHGQKVDGLALYTHTGEITSSEVTGTDNSTSIVDRTRLQMIQRELAFAQLVGDHAVTDRVAVEWQGNVARVAQHEPDTRDLLRTQTTDGKLAISSGPGNADRLFGELADTALGGAAATRLKITDDITVKAGGAIQNSDRTYQQRRFTFQVQGDNVFADPDTAFAPTNAAAGALTMFEATLPSDGYRAKRLVAAAFAMADAKLTSDLRVIGGARFEHAALDVGLDSQIDLMIPPMPHTKRADDDVLPSLNAVYALTQDMNLRAAYGLTVARPNFREIAPALYYDYVRRRVIGGNPNLAETTIHNGDLRWEMFLGDTEVLAASVFAKHFVSPIEKTVENAGDGDNISFANAPSANSYGAELEARISLGRISGALADFTVGGNLALIGSQIAVADGAPKRPLQGQSAYVVNAGLGYASATSGTRADVLFNTFGRRIEEVGTAGAGNIYEQPFHRLDATVAQDLPGGFRVKVAGTNLLDQRVARTQDGVEIFAYQVGVTVIGSLEFVLP